MVHYGFIRPAEALRLQWEDVNFDTNRIILPGTKSKNKKTESVYMPKPLRRALEKVQNRDRTAYLLPNYTKQCRSFINRRHREIRLKLGLDEGLTIYALKHTGTQHVYRQMPDIKMVQTMCRHSDSSITDKYLRGFGFQEQIEEQIKIVKW